MKISEEEILDISPDSASTKNAQKLYNKTKWIVKKSQRAIWSEIYGSGKKPYLTQIDIGSLAFKCSCPSRKFPCKHGLALGLYLASHGIESITQDSEPIWVEEWINKRTKKRQEKPKEVKSPEKLKENLEAKWEKASKDIEVLEMWLLDNMKLGILNFPNYDYSYWQELRKRMVDIKLSGINIFFTLLEEIDYEAEWEESVLLILSDLYLLIESIKRYKTLEENFKNELERLLGWSLSKQKLLLDEKATIIDDTWMVVGVDIDKSESLTSRKVYLYGIKNNKWAYILEFSHGGSYFEDQFTKGSFIKAKLVFDSGVLQIRAYLKERDTTPSKIDYNLIKPIESIQLAYQYYKKRKIIFPWLFEQPLFIAQCNIVKHSKRYYLVDKENSVIALNNFGFDKYLNTLAKSRGEFFDAFIVQNRDGAEFLGFYQDKKVEVI